MDLDVIVAGLLCFSALCYVLLALRLLKGPREPGNLPIALTSVTLGLWVLGGAVMMIAASQAPFAIGRLGHFIGAALVPVGLLTAFRVYTGASASRGLVALLLVVPLTSIVVAATNPWHSLMWSGPAADSTGAFLVRPAAWGPWFLFVHAPYSYLLAGMAILKLLLHGSGIGASRRRGLMALSIASLVPIGATLAYDFGFGPATIPFVPMVFAAMCPVFAWLVIAERVTEFSPIAYETVFQNMVDPVVVLDEQGRVVGLNRGAESLLNVRESGAFRTSIEQLFGNEFEEVYEAIDTGRPCRLVTSTGRFLHVQASPIESRNTLKSAGRVLMFRDVSDVERAQADVRSSEILLRTLFDHSVNGLVRMRWRKDEDAEGPVLTCVSANAAAARYLDVEAEAVNDLSADELLAIATAGMAREAANDVRDRFHSGICRGEVVDTEVRPLEGADGRWLRMIGEPVGDNVAVTFIDVTNNKAKEAQMQSMASTDPLTGVLNRRGFEQDASLQLLESGDESSGALLFVDLNQFKQINDRCGHGTGDQLLQIAAERLRTSLRSCDVIGRLGGDEFVALVPNVPPDVAEGLAERLTESLEQPYHVGNDVLFCSASIGLALYPEHADTLTGLLRAADEAMYRAKSRAHSLAALGPGDRRRLLEKAG